MSEPIPADHPAVKAAHDAYWAAVARLGIDPEWDVPDEVMAAALTVARPLLLPDEEQLVVAMEASPDCVHPGSPRAVSDVHAYIPVRAAAEIMVARAGEVHARRDRAVEALERIVYDTPPGTTSSWARGVAMNALIGLDVTINPALCSDPAVGRIVADALRYTGADE